MKNTISVVLRNFIHEKGFKNPNQFAKTHGFPSTSFNNWYNGEAVPRAPRHRQKLFKLTNHPIFEGGLTREKRRQSLTPIVPRQALGERANRLGQLIKAVLPDIKWMVLNGDVRVRDEIRAIIGEQKLAEFTVLARAFSSEDSLELLQKSSQLPSVAKGGSHE